MDEQMNCHLGRSGTHQAITAVTTTYATHKTVQETAKVVHMCQLGTPGQILLLESAKTRGNSWGQLSCSILQHDCRNSAPLMSSCHLLSYIVVHTEDVSVF